MVSTSWIGLPTPIYCMDFRWTCLGWSSWCVYLYIYSYSYILVVLGILPHSQQTGSNLPVKMPSFFSLCAYVHHDCLGLWFGQETLGGPSRSDAPRIGFRESLQRPMVFTTKTMDFLQMLPETRSLRCSVKGCLDGQNDEGEEVMSKKSGILWWILIVFGCWVVCWAL